MEDGRRADAKCEANGTTDAMLKCNLSLNPQLELAGHLISMPPESLPLEDCQTCSTGIDPQLAGRFISFISSGLGNPSGSPRGSWKNWHQEKDKWKSTTTAMWHL